MFSIFKNTDRQKNQVNKMGKLEFFRSTVIHYSSQIEKHVDKQSKSSPSKDHEFVKVADK